MTGPRTLLAAALAALVLAPLSGPPAAASPVPPRLAAPAASPAGSPAHPCAAPALAPSLPVGWVGAESGAAKEARAVASRGRMTGQPARAQALAVSAVLAGDLRDGPQSSRFYRSLAKVDGWQTLPPTIAVHRVLGTPDPFRYEPHWTRTVSLLARLSGRSPDLVERAVSTAGDAPARCAASPLSARAIPLPAGTGYSVAAADAAPAAAEQAADRDAGTVLFGAACGTPVLAATPGTVTIVRDDEAGGPWVLGVRQGDDGVTAWYSHVQNPAVAHGEQVFVGQQLAEVGDLGSVDACALGFTVSGAEGTALDPDALLRWLAARAPAPGAVPTPTGTPGGTQQVAPATSFRIAAFNVLGAHLTGPGSSRPHYGPGPARMLRGLEKLEAARVSVVVLNEFETPQANVVLGDGDWELHRATPNNRFRNGTSGGNAVAWRADTWTALRATEFVVPWKVRLHMPVVTLQHRQTGARMTVIGVHNPASTKAQGDQSGARRTAREIQLAQIRALREREPTIPVFLAGDLNERDVGFCAFTAAGTMRSSAGGSVGTPCRPPRHGPVDWIFASTDVAFQGQVIDRSTLGSISDHPLLSATAVLPEQVVGD